MVEFNKEQISENELIEAVFNIDDKRFFKLVADGRLNESILKDVDVLQEIIGDPEVNPAVRVNDSAGP